VVGQTHKYEVLLQEEHEGILYCTLNRPDRLNAINGQLHRELEVLFRDLTSRDEIRVVVLRGAGRAFSSGGDIRGMIEEGLSAQEGPSGLPGGMYTGGALHFIRYLVDVPQPIIASVRGPAIGLGATVALFSDIVLASEDAQFGDTHVSVGLVAGDGGAVIWPLLVGVNKAKELLMTGEIIDAEEAFRLGLVNHIYPSDELDGATEEFARRLANGAPAALRWTKTSINKVLRDRVNLILDTSLALEGLSGGTKDHQEGISAFLEKRPPTFKGE